LASLFPATFQPLSSRFPAPENPAFSEACAVIAQPGDFRAIPPEKKPRSETGADGMTAA
jgi:hypothetical protein